MNQMRNRQKNYRRSLLLLFDSFPLFLSLFSHQLSFHCRLLFWRRELPHRTNRCLKSPKNHYLKSRCLKSRCLKIPLLLLISLIQQPYEQLLPLLFEPSLQPPFSLASLLSCYHSIMQNVCKTSEKSVLNRAIKIITLTFEPIFEIEKVF